MEQLVKEIKELLISVLDLEEMSPEEIGTDEQLFGADLGLDSIDALELGLAIKKKYDVSLSSEDEDNKKYFYSVKTLAEFITSQA